MSLYAAAGTTGNTGGWGQELSALQEGYKEKLSKAYGSNSSKAYAQEGPRPFVVIHCGQRGADTLAGEWARSMTYRQIPVVEWPFPATRDSLGPSAGPIRNKAMLYYGRPELVVAFPGGLGTGRICAHGTLV